MLLVASWASITFAQPGVEKLVAASDPAIQAQIRVVYDSQSELEMFRQVQTLKEIAGDKTEDQAELVKQLAIFSVTSPNQKEFHALLTLVILDRLDLQPSISIRVLAPYLDSENKQLRDFARDWFRCYDKVAFEDPWKAYGSYVGNRLTRNEKVPREFVEYLYERSPERALLVFLRAARLGNTVARLMKLQEKREADLQKIGQNELDRRDDELAARLAEWNKKMAAIQGKYPPPVPPVPPLPPMTNPPDVIPRQLGEKLQKEILLAEHIVSNAIWLKKKKFDEQFQKALPKAKQQLAKLAEYDQWWARLYVVQIMRRHRELRLDDVLDRLSRDSNALVSELAMLVTRR